MTTIHATKPAAMKSGSRPSMAIALATCRNHRGADPCGDQRQHHYQENEKPLGILISQKPSGRVRFIFRVWHCRRLPPA